MIETPCRQAGLLLAILLVIRQKTIFEIGQHTKYVDVDICLGCCMLIDCRPRFLL